jgi:hypothetical protein
MSRAVGKMAIESAFQTWFWAYVGIDNQGDSVESATTPVGTTVYVPRGVAISAQAALAAYHLNRFYCSGQVEDIRAWISFYQTWVNGQVEDQDYGAVTDAYNSILSVQDGYSVSFQLDVGVTENLGYLDVRADAIGTVFTSS